MSNLDDRTLDEKLSRIFRLAVTFCLLVTTISFSAVFFFYLSRSFVRELSSVTSVVGATSRAALVFKDGEAGQRVLSALKGSDDIIFGLLQTNDSLSLAEVGERPIGVEFPTSEASNTVRWSFKSVTVSQAINLDQDRVGTIHTVWSLKRIYSQGGLFILVSLAVLTVAMLGAYWFRLQLRTWVSRPLIALKDLIHDVSITKNFSSRLIESQNNDNDEVQRLIKTFNFMMEQIQERDRAIHLAKEKAEQADKMKSIFLATVSHELRTPLHAILGMTDEVLGSPLNEEQSELLNIVKSSGSLLISIINDILDFSKIEAGKLVLIPGEIELRFLLEKVLKMFMFSARKKNIELKLDLSEAVPAVVYVDSARLAQILVNLIGNAIKFTDSGAVELTVRRSCEVVRAGYVQLEFSVRDTGIGIPDSSLSTIFESFSQVSRGKGHTEGTGLGLAISSRLVTLMSGRIWVESQVGVGSKFSFLINLEQSLNDTIIPDAEGPDSVVRAAVEREQEGAVGQKPEEKLRGDTPSGNGPTILVVEDNPVNIKLAYRVLSRSGYRVLIAENGQECLDQYAGEKVDLILMDIGMPVMDGLETARRIRALEKLENVSRRRVPIIALTANFADEQGANCFEAGMDEFLTKPLESKKLLNSIAQLLDSSSSR